MNQEYYKKYLKYKTKYLELLKQSGGDPIGAINKQIDSSTPWYNLSDHTLFCTSDFEGGNPFTNLRSSDAGKASTNVTNALNNAFEMKDGLIINLKPNTAFAFLGDLMDNHKFSIRLMQRMINLKETSPRKVILLGGNRDFNKIRMGIELFLQTKEKDLPWDGTNTIQDLLDRLSKVEFEFRHKGIPDYLRDVNLWDKIIIDNKLDVYNDINNISGRLNAMYSNTLGIMNKTKFMKEELNDMFKITLSNYSDEVVDKLLCTIHMVMAFDWSCVKLPGYLSEFNGLYQKYLTLCHVIAGFRINNKIGILSHGSLPINTDKGNRTLTYPFGYDANSPLFTEYEKKVEIDNNASTSGKFKDEIVRLKSENKTKKSSLLSIISMIELEKKELMTEYQKLRNIQYTYENFPMVTKFVHLTALTKDINYPQANATYSPVVWSQPEDISKFPDIQLRLGGESNSLSGGSPGYKNWIENDKPKSRHIVDAGNDYVHYNIFGHAPNYFNPIYYRKDKTLHVNLDISKAEAQANSYSFSFLVINKTDTKLIGRIQFNKADKVGYATEEIRKKLSDHDHYYNEVISESGPVKLLKTDNIISLEYHVVSSGPPDFHKLIKGPLT